MVFELTENYIPKELLFRDKQREEIESTFKNFKKFGFGAGGNKLVIGSTGVGKTAMTLQIISKEDGAIFVSARENNTPNKIIKSLIGKKEKKDTSDLIESLINNLKDERKILIIDEVDKCSNVRGLGSILDTIYRATGVPIIIISNNWDIIKMLPDDAQKTLAFGRVEFHSYSSPQLFDILEARLKVIEEKYVDFPKFRSDNDGWDDDGLKKFIASRIVRMFNGSVRMLFNIASKCIERNKFTKGFVEEEIQKMSKDGWIQMIAGLGQTEKEFLTHLLELSDEKDFVLSSEISSIMIDLSGARISQIVKILFENGIIVMKGVPSGNAGNRLRAISFASEEIKQGALRIFRPWDDLPDEGIAQIIGGGNK